MGLRRFLIIAEYSLHKIYSQFACSILLKFNQNSFILVRIPEQWWLQQDFELDTQEEMQSLSVAHHTLQEVLAHLKRQSLTAKPDRSVILSTDTKPQLNSNTEPPEISLSKSPSNMWNPPSFKELTLNTDTPFILGSNSSY